MSNQSPDTSGIRNAAKKKSEETLNKVLVRSILILYQILQELLKHGSINSLM